MKCLQISWTANKISERQRWILGNFLMDYTHKYQITWSYFLEKVNDCLCFYPFT